MKMCILEKIGKNKGFKTNEEYKEYLKRKNKCFVGLIVVGILLAVVGFGAEFLADKLNLTITINDYRNVCYFSHWWIVLSHITKNIIDSNLYFSGGVSCLLCYI